MKLVSWNVNGIRAVVGKGNFFDYFNTLNADIFCLQETKAQVEQVKTVLFDLVTAGYEIYANEAVKKGYSGTAIISKTPALNVTYDMGIEAHDQEGRVICAEYTDYFVVTVYTPNAKNDLSRLDYRTQWDADFCAYMKKLEEQKPVIFCGDLNVAHRPIDLARPKENYDKSAGFTQKEIDGMDRFIDQGFVDTFRHQHPHLEAMYTWWSYRGGARERNVGWRIDYVMVSAALADRIADAHIYNEFVGSDHCPVGVELK